MPCPHHLPEPRGRRTGALSPARPKRFLDIDCWVLGVAASWERLPCVNLGAVMPAPRRSIGVTHSSRQRSGSLAGLRLCMVAHDGTSGGSRAWQGLSGRASDWGPVPPLPTGVRKGSGYRTPPAGDLVRWDGVAVDAATVGAVAQWGSAGEATQPSLRRAASYPDGGHRPRAAADSLVDEHRRHLDVVASWGVPAYVSVLYPYVTADPGTRMPRPRSRPASRSSIASFTASSG